MELMNNKENSFTFIDLFAGIGGFRAATEKAGGVCIYTSEQDEFCKQTYTANFSNHHPVAGDITRIDAEEIPDHNLLLSGFPCQSFSHAGLKMGFSDKTRGTLFFEISRILKHHRPEAFLLENVKGLKSHDNGNTLRTMIRVLRDLEYNLSVEVLNARHFGIPQNRERIFIVGFRDHSNFSFPCPPMKISRVGDILQEEVDEKYTISDKIWASHKERKKRARAKGYGFGYSIFNKDSSYTGTLSSRYYKDGSEILIEQKDKNPRMLTPRECARLMGFPDTFKIPVSNTQAYRQFGNSVVIPVVEAITKEMSLHINQKKESKQCRISPTP